MGDRNGDCHSVEPAKQEDDRCTYCCGAAGTLDPRILKRNMVADICASSQQGASFLRASHWRVKTIDAGADVGTTCDRAIPAAADIPQRPNIDLAVGWHASIAHVLCRDRRWIGITAM